MDLRETHLKKVHTCHTKAAARVKMQRVGSPSAEPPYGHLIDTLKDGRIKFFNPQKLNDPRYGELAPFDSKISNVHVALSGPAAGQISLAEICTMYCSNTAHRKPVIRLMFTDSLIHIIRRLIQ